MELNCFLSTHRQMGNLHQTILYTKFLILVKQKEHDTS